jgi:hypothetical protein
MDRIAGEMLKIKNYIFTFGFILISLSACGSLPSSPTPDLVGTMVAATLTSAPTWTPPPSATVPVTPTVSPTQTPLPTETGTPGPTPTATVRPLPASDPRFGLDLSSPYYVDDFSRRFTWVEWKDEITSHLVISEKLESVDFLTDSMVWWTTTSPTGGDIYIEVTAEIGECAGKDFAGVGLRIGADLSSGYTLEIACDGNYRIRKFAAGIVEVILDWTSASSIQTSTNTIGFVARGNKLSAVLNDMILETVTDSSYFSGTFSLFAGAEQTPGLRIFFYDFKIWYFSS